LAVKPRILVISDSEQESEALPPGLAESHDAEQVQNPLRALVRLKREEFDGVYVSSAHLKDALQIGKMLLDEQIVEGMPDGVVLLDTDNTVIWGNGRLREWCGGQEVVGQNFYSALGSPEILGPDYCPFHTALATGTISSSTLRAGDNRYFRVHAAPVHEQTDQTQNLIVTIRDVTAEVLQQQKLEAIHHAGLELADLAPDEIANMSVEERIELLKSNILHYTQDLLNFDVVEIRLLDAETGRLETLLSVGMVPEAMQRALYARPQGNGVTGFVAATGKSYLCEDTTADPLYIEGARDAKSSLTVPLLVHGEVFGTFNVESPEPGAFTESDLQFLEIFSRDVAVALNTLELLVAEKASTAAASVEAIHAAVALPVDEILNDAVNIMERYIGHEPDVADRLRQVLRNARDIKQVIQKVGRKMAPAQAQPHPQNATGRPDLAGRQVLVVDADENVRSAAHALLERYGCTVETAHDGAEAAFMVRSMGPDAAYDVIIVDIRLPDMNGYELMVKMQEILDYVPLVLMTSFGYDPAHSIVKARRAGLRAVLYKPFRLDQLLDTVEQMIQSPRTVTQS